MLVPAVAVHSDLTGGMIAEVAEICPVMLSSALLVIDLGARAGGLVASAFLAAAISGDSPQFFGGSGAHLWHRGVHRFFGRVWYVRSESLARSWAVAALAPIGGLCAGGVRFGRLSDGHRPRRARARSSRCMVRPALIAGGLIASWGWGAWLVLQQR